VIASDYKTGHSRKNKYLNERQAKIRQKIFAKHTSDKKLSKCISNSHNSTSKNKYVDLKYGQEAQMITFSK
jgi:triosephosphate isomerase